MSQKIPRFSWERLLSENFSLAMRTNLCHIYDCYNNLAVKKSLSLNFLQVEKNCFFSWLDEKMMFRLDNLSLDKAYSWKLIVENQFIFNNFTKKCCKLHMCANKYITSIYIVSMNMAYKIWKNWFKIIFMLFDRLCCVLLEWFFKDLKIP